MQSQDLVTGDEILSDSYDLKEIDGVVYEANCTKITLGNETFGTSQYQLALSFWSTFGSNS